MCVYLCRELFHFIFFKNQLQVVPFLTDIYVYVHTYILDTRTYICIFNDFIILFDIFICKYFDIELKY